MCLILHQEAHHWKEWKLVKSLAWSDLNSQECDASSDHVCEISMFTTSADKENSVLGMRLWNK